MSGPVQSLGDDPAGELSIRRVHLASIDNAYLGQACWLDEFDSALRRKVFASCQELLTEIQQGGYQLSRDMQVFVESRQAALLLGQGLHYHGLGAYDQARQCYEAARHLHHILGNNNGEGQAQRALEELEQLTHPDTALLEQLAAHPSVQGD